MKFGEIIAQLGSSQSVGDRDLEITGVAAVDKASSGTLSYVDRGKPLRFVQETQASALILPPDSTLQAAATDRGIAWLEVPAPRLAFAQAIALFYQPYRPAPHIHPSAVIDPSAKLGQNVSIGAHVVISADVTIGDDTCIHPNVVVYPDVQIGDRVTLHSNCTIQEHVRIGHDCVINSGTVIGGEGFGYVPTPQGWYKMNQSGYVILEDKVEVGCNCAIDRPSVGETRIGRDTKLDNMVHIAHGVQIGSGCAIAAQVGIAGGVTLGNYVILAGQVGVANEAKLGDRSVASSKAGVHGDVEPGQIVSGYPAIDHKIYLRAYSLLKKLPEMYQAIRQIKKQLGIKD